MFYLPWFERIVYKLIKPDIGLQDEFKYTIR